MESYISCALPGIGEETIKKLDEKLKDIGVIVFEDLKYVEEEHIKEVLKPIQLKKFLVFCKGTTIIPSVNFAPDDSCADQAESADISHEDVGPVSNSSNTWPSIENKNWAEDFSVPFNAFPKEIGEADRMGKQPSKLHVNEMVRTVVTQILNVTETPGRRNLRIIANKIIKQFPGSFQDQWGSSVIGDGTSTLMKKLENCIDNKKRMRCSIEECYSNVPKKRKNLRASYGCVLWQPSDLPDGETVEELSLCQQWLKTEFMKVEQEEEKVHNLMEKCYGMQRYFINNVKSSIVSVQEEWPFLLHKDHLLQHATALVGKDLGKIFCEDMPKKGKKIYNFMLSYSKPMKLASCIKKIESAKIENGNVLPEHIGAIPLLMAYFEEDESLLFKEKISPDDIKTESLLTPYLVTFGSNLYNAKEFAVVIDGHITTYSTHFPTALAILFASYFVFNIEYNADTALTMEFIQRCIADINPSRGTKISQKEKVKHGIITRKVVKLATAINDHEKVFKL